jgi:putative phosphoesterase
MKIGIISDTHDDVDNINKAIDIFEEEKVEVIIHAGDVISPPMIKEFQRLMENNVQFFGVLGNNDGEKKGLELAFDSINGKLLGDFGKIEIDSLKFGIYHGTDDKKVKKIINSNKFDVFIYGHTHRKFPENVNIEKIGKTIVLNPGSAHSKAKMNYTEPPYFNDPSIMIFSNNSKSIKFYNL